MTRELSIIYLSGEQVSDPGIYAVVGIEINDEDADLDVEYICELQPGQLFPAYKGWTVGWRFIRSVELKPYPKSTGKLPSSPNRHLPWV